MDYINDGFAGFRFSSMNDNKYFYDDNTGIVFYCPDVMYEILKQYKTKEREQLLQDFACSYSKEEVIKYYNLIDKWTKKHNSFFYKENNSKSLIPTDKDIRDFVFMRGFHQLVLNITDNCNLRCNYCVYFSGNYSYHNRQNQAKMDFETAKKAIDFYLDGYKKVKKRSPYKKGAISFYGGEPLLNFELIKEIIGYIKSLGEHGNITYNITTNGTLLKPEIVDFLVDNGFAISVSLDGPEDIHDKNRKYVNGKGSYSTVMKNLEILRERYPNYMFLLILSCYDFDTNFVKVNQFFKEIEQNISPAMIKVTPISPYFTTYYNQFDKIHHRTFEDQAKILRETYFSEIINSGCSSKYLETLVGADCRGTLLRPIIDDPHSNIIPHTSACIPGIKIFVNSNGILHICEKVNGNFPIGDVDNGLDFTKIFDIVQSYRRQILTGCDRCPITRLCNVCYVHFAGDGSFEKTPDFCENMRQKVFTRLRFTYSILEKKPDAYKFIVENYYDKSREKLIHEDF